MTSSTKFSSFYDPAVAATPQEPSIDASSAAVDVSVGSIHDETDAIDERDDDADATVDISTLAKSVKEEKEVTIKSLQNSLTAARDELAKMQSAEENLKSKLNEEMSTNKALKEDNVELAKGIAALTKSVKGLKMEKVDAEEKISSRTKKMVELKKDLKSATKLMAKLQEVETDLQAKLEKEQQTTEALKDTEKELQTKLEEERQTHVEEKMKMQSEIDALTVVKTDNDELRTDNNELREEIKKMKSNEERLQAQLEEARIAAGKESKTSTPAHLRAKNAALVSQLQILKEDLAAAEDTIEDTVKEVEDLTTDVDSLTAQCAALTQSRDMMRDDLEDAEDTIDEKMSEIEDLTNDLKVATDAMASMKSNQKSIESQIEEEVAKVEALEEDKASLEKEVVTLSKSIETHTKKIAEMELNEEKMARLEKDIDELTVELETARAEMAEMTVNEEALKQKLNFLLDQIDEKDETIALIQETNKELMSRRSIPTARSRSRSRTAELFGEEDVLAEKKVARPTQNRVRSSGGASVEKRVRKTPPRARNSPRRSRSSLSMPEMDSDVARARVFEIAQEVLSAVELEIEVDQENNAPHPLEF